MNVVLISTYELGHQPFGLTSAAAWLKREGAEVTCQDAAVQHLDKAALAAADLIGYYVPMHTATRIAAQFIPTIKAHNPRAHLMCFGLYAPLNESYLRKLGVNTILGGEFEEGLAVLYRRVAASLRGAHPERSAAESKGSDEVISLSEEEIASRPSTSQQRNAASPRMLAMTGSQPEPIVSLARQEFILPDRHTLPHLSKYAHLIRTDGQCPKVGGYTEASRGCKHHCRHCPVVPVYGGQFRLVQSEIVIEDIEQQVNSGAGHITFGDPDFFNGPGHVIPIIEKLHQLWPHLTYDVTIKIEHLLKQQRWLPLLRDTGCLFVTSAVESLDDEVLEIFDKRHTREDFFKVAALFKDTGLVLHPTFVAFNPWATLNGYLDLMQTVAQLNLVENVAPIQWGVRLLIPAGSLLLDRAEVRSAVGEFDEAALAYRWVHPDPRIDRLCETALAIIKEGQDKEQSRSEIFDRVWQAACEAAGERRDLPAYSRQPVPRLSEDWFC
jgi:radical SAM superfamily enzyme YgiQ (UPF0313 family)